VSRPLVLLTAGLAALTACGGGTAAGQTGASQRGKYCAVIRLLEPSPSGIQLSITAMDTKFDTTCLAAPADTPFTIRFDNEDSNTHNLDILDHGRSLFDGAVIIGPKVTTYSVQALPVGVYTFRCDVHPTQMHGTFVVGHQPSAGEPTLP
jgi:plastocyanin